MNMFVNGSADRPHRTSFILKVVFVFENEVVESKDKADYPGSESPRLLLGGRQTKKETLAE